MFDLSKAPQGVLLSVRNIDKRLPGVHALRDVSLDVSAGQVHAVVGENGAGKSTLMRCLSGVHPPDSGTIVLDGQEVTFASPSAALSAGIAMVWQDTRLVPTLDVASNIYLGHEPGGSVFVDRSEMIQAARTLLERIGSGVDPRAIAGDLTRAEMQQVEIARALSRDARVLILDEPTSALTPAETEGLFQLVDVLRAEGRAILFISHRMPEIMAHSDMVTVLKDGAAVGSVRTADTTPQALVAMMVGREMGLVFPDRATHPGAIVLSVDAVRTSRLAPDAPGLSFEVRAGEVVGFGGIEGSGQQAAARALFGLNGHAGSISVNGQPVQINAPVDALRSGIVYVPADRRAEGLFLPHGIRENVALPNLPNMSRAGLIQSATERSEVTRATDRLAVKAPDIETHVAKLSGGNQQKVVFARWLVGDAPVVIFDEPTQGVDVGAKQEIYRIIRSIAADGAAVIVISSDLPELIGLTDRILVFNDGAIVKELPSADCTEEDVIGSALTQEQSTAPLPEGTEPVAGRAGPTRPGQWTQRYAPALILAVLALGLIAAATTVAPYFLTPRNFGSMAGQLAPVALAALGQMATILLGGIDLSIGPTISLVTAVASYLLSPESGLPVGIGLLACIAVGGAVGCLNGFLTTIMRIPDLVATLATFTIVQGLALIVRPSPGGRVDPETAAMITERIGRMPVAFLLVVVAFIAVEMLLVRGRLGARFYAVGSNPEAARAAGIAADRIRFAAYVFSGTMAALAGLMIAARIGSGDPQAGTTFSLASVTAVVIGGTSVFGGIGTAIGTFFGAVLIILMQNILNQVQINAYWQYVWTGVLTLIAVGAHSFRSAERRAQMRGALKGLVRRHRQREAKNAKG